MAVTSNWYDYIKNKFNLNGQLMPFEAGVIAIHERSFVSGEFMDQLLKLDIEDQKMQVYRRRICEEWPETIVEYSIVIGRRLFLLTYRDKDAESVRNYPVEEILQDVEFLSIGDVNWSDLTIYDDREKGDIDKATAVSG